MHGSSYVVHRRRVWPELVMGRDSSVGDEHISRPQRRDHLPGELAGWHHQPVTSRMTRLLDCTPRRKKIVEHIGDQEYGPHMQKFFLAQITIQDEYCTKQLHFRVGCLITHAISSHAFRGTTFTRVCRVHCVIVILWLARSVCWTWLETRYLIKRERQRNTKRLMHRAP